MTSAYAADPMFDANPRQISNLISRIYNGELALPDFQRNFVWDVKSTVELLRSVMCRFPAGTLLFWKQGNPESGLAEREFEGAPVLAGKKPDELVLDGQQRLTALYQALNDPSVDRYFAIVNEFLDSEGAVKAAHEVDFDKAIIHIDVSGKLKFDPSDLVWQFEQAAFPLNELDKFDQWLDKYARKIEASVEGEDRVKTQLRGFRDAYLVPLRSYGFPVVALPATTPLEAVCKIFETLNKTGKPLGAFDLLTAKFYPKGVNLRDLWDEARAAYSILEEFDVEPYALLQATSLRARGSAQRSDVLNKLTAAEVETHWPLVSAGAAAVLDLMASDYGVVHKRWLPYGMLLVPMAAVWPEVKALKPLDRSSALDRMRQYFWCTTFMTNYDQGANSQAGADYIKLLAWLPDGSDTAPEAVGQFSLSEDVVRTASVRRKALHAGVMALTIGKGAKDFHTGQKLTAQRMLDQKIDSHHVFPRAYLVDQKLGDSELILNRALIDSETNKIIGKRAPSLYLTEMESRYGAEKLADVLDSHAVPAGPSSALLTDSYRAFLEDRAELIIELIEEVTGHAVVRTAP